MKRRRRLSLAEVQRRYMEADHGTYGHDIAVAFGLWLERENLSLEDLGLGDVHRFVRQPGDGPIKAGTQNAYRHRVRHYLRYLHQHGFLSFDPSLIHGRRRKPVPELVERYIELLRPLNRASTLHAYRSELRQFHEWLDRKGRTPAAVDRHVVLDWLAHLHDGGWAAQRRINAIALVGRYLGWLCEEGVVPDDPAGLIRSGDYPRKPQYLPRPVPPQADRELQVRLRDSGDSAAQALLVMRRTGLRLGELRKLEHDCVRELPDGTPMLKVPLGKLYNERLVPMDADTRELVDSLRAENPDGRWLIEGVRGRPVGTERFRAVLRAASAGLAIPDRMVTHRLRHTYATSLLNAGMSLVSVMHLLGHRDVQMTMRYAAVTQETVSREFFEAVTMLEERYALPDLGRVPAEKPFDPVEALNDLMRWLKKQATGDRERLAWLLMRRVENLRAEVRELANATDDT